MSPDLLALAEVIDANPSDRIAIRALADWIEERGGMVEELRELTVGDGDLILLGIDDEVSPSQFDSLRAGAAHLQEQLRSLGRNVVVGLMPKSLTIRQIRTQLKERVLYAF